VDSERDEENSGRKTEMHSFLTDRMTKMTEKMLLKEKIRS